MQVVHSVPCERRRVSCVTELIQVRSGVRSLWADQVLQQFKASPVKSFKQMEWMALTGNLVMIVGCLDTDQNNRVFIKWPNFEKSNGKGFIRAEEMHTVQESFTWPGFHEAEVNRDGIILLGSIEWDKLVECISPGVQIYHLYREQSQKSPQSELNRCNSSLLSSPTSEHAAEECCSFN